MESLRFENLGTVRPLLCVDNNTYVSRGYVIFRWSEYNEDEELVACWKAPLLKRIVSTNRFGARISRGGVQKFLAAESGELFAIVRGQLLHSGVGEGKLVPVFSFSDGSRPLNLCEIPRYGFYFGEYFSNPSRREVNIFGSKDGCRWHSVFRFPAGSIRHIHGIYYDQYRNGAWVLTGDENHECGLWFSCDGFQTMTGIVTGEQKVRAVSIIPLEQGVIVPMDSPFERNYIQMLDVDTGELTPVCEVPGSVFDAVVSDGVLLVSTVVEPSDVNTDQRVAVFASLNGEHWQCIGQFERDLPQSLDRYFQYPRLVLSPNRGQSEWVYGYAIGLAGIDGNGIRWRLDDIRERLSRI